MKTLITLATVLLFMQSNSYSQFIIDTAGKKFSIDFENYSGTGFCSNPSPGQLDSDAWAIKGMSDGTLNFGDTKTATGTDFTRGKHNGLTGTGGIYAFNTGNNIILGVQAIGSDFTPGSFILRLQNLTGDSIKSIFLSYEIFFINDQGRGNSFNFSYSTDSINYSDMPSLDFATKDTAVNNPIWERAGRSILLNGFSIAPYSYFYFRWAGDDHNGTGNRDEYGIDNINVIANPLPVVADFSATSVCVNSATHFTDASWSVIDSVISRQWNFGDFSTSSAQNPSHLYQNPGTYPVQLIATTTGGDSDTLTKDVIVHANPVAHFSASAVTGCAPLEVSFRDSSLAGSGIFTSNTWNFGNGNSDSTINTTHLFTSEGSYRTQLQVITDFGCTDTTSVLISVGPAPIANFGYTQSIAQVTFSDSSTISNGALTYFWDFGDGDTSSMNNPTHAYLSEGTHTVVLYVQSANGCTDSVSKTINITYTAVPDVMSNNFIRIFPNPLTGGQLTIDQTPVNNNSSALVITNMLGEIMFIQKINTPGTQLNLQEFAPGIYTITVVNEQNKFSEKLIIK